MSATPYADRLRAKLSQALRPQTLEVVDESHRHAGHAHRLGHAGQEGETHFKVTIVSDAFTGLNRVARQRLVYDTVAEELVERVHALALVTKAPGE